MRRVPEFVFFALMSLGLLAAVSAHAAGVPATYIVNGHSASPQEAIIAAIKGNDVLQCKPVEMKVSKSGTSIGLKAKKKPVSNNQ